MSHNPHRRTALSCAFLLVPVVAGVSACSGQDHPLAADPYDADGQVSFAGAAKAAEESGEKPVDPDRPLQVAASGDGNRITDVTAVDASGRYVQGRLSDDGSRWHSTVPLAAQARYTVRVSTEDSSGAPGRKTLSLRTGKPSEVKRLKVKLGPHHGTYGVGQPLTVKLSMPLKDPRQRAAVEHGLHVSSSPSEEGAWYWVNSRELHYRPEAYWPAHARITLRSTLDGVQIRPGLFGAKTKPLRLKTGAKVVAVTDSASHKMTYYRDGKSVKEIPVTTGKPGFETRNGTKVVLERQQFVRMRGTTVGIAAGSADSYDLPVYWATRVTWSGEYVHAAPWSVGSQGAANVSHGCTGMSTANAEWFFEHVREGDIVQVVNSGGDTMEPFGNGFGDWNMSWKQWREGSVLTKNGSPLTGEETGRGRLRPQV
jgi:lipoprotein-anchoring transpeptidase ErfK/SrfK